VFVTTQLTQVNSAVFVIGSEPLGHLHNHWMLNAHMCALAIVMATCSYGIYFWRMVVIGYRLMLLLFGLGCRWRANLLQATWWKCRKILLSAWQS